MLSSIKPWPLIAELYEARESDRFYPAQEFSRYLLAHVKEWNETSWEAAKLEKWLATLEQASNYGIVRDRDEREINKLIEQNPGLRQQLCLCRIERIAAEPGGPTKEIWQLMRGSDALVQSLRPELLAGNAA